MATGTLETGLSDREVFPKAMELFLPSWLLPFMAVVFMAVIMSSLDSFAFVAGQCLANDGFAVSSRMPAFGQNSIRGWAFWLSS